MKREGKEEQWASEREREGQREIQCYNVHVHVGERDAVAERTVSW